MSPRLNKRVSPPQDKDGKYIRACKEFCEELGFPVVEAWQLWAWLARMHEFEQRIPRALAEARAMTDLRALLDKRGHAHEMAN